MSKNELAKSQEGETERTREAVSAADVAFIEALAKLLRENDLAEIEVEREFGDDDELKVRLSRSASVAIAAPAAAAPMMMAAPAAAAAAAPSAVGEAAGSAASDVADHPGCVKSQMPGTVYLAAEPGAAPFVSAGDTVTEGQTLLIIEAMKHMNQIASPKSGVVKQVLVANAEAVEYGTPLVIIE